MRGRKKGPAAKRSRVEKFFGDKELSDAILKVGNVNLHETDQKTFTICEDQSAFTLIIEIIYGKKMDAILCNGFCLASLRGRAKQNYDDNCYKIDSWWRVYELYLSLSQKYELFRDVWYFIELQFLALKCSQPGCLVCTMRGLLALNYKFTDIETRIKMTPESMAFCLQRIDKLTTVFNIAPSALMNIIVSGNRVTKAPDSSADDDTAAEADTSVIVMEFADSDLSDVTLLIGNYEFKVHKMSLASRSPYFRTMFYSEFVEKNKDRIPIDADGETFKYVLDMIYHGILKNVDFLICNSGDSLQNAWPRVAEFWKTMPEIMETLEFFQLPSNMVETSLLLHYCRKIDCVECAMKKVFAMNYNLDNVKKTVVSSSETIASCLRNFPECLPEQLSFVPKELADIVEDLGKAKTAGKSR